MKKKILITIIKIAVHKLLQAYLPAEITKKNHLVKALSHTIMPLLPLPVRVSLVIFLFCLWIQFRILFNLILYYII